MKKIAKLFLLIFLSLICFTKTTYASISWTKYPNNPVLTGRGLSFWEGPSVQGQSVIKSGNSYKMWFNGNNGNGWRIGYADSTTGTNNWNLSGSQVIPLNNKDGWEKEEADPSVIFDSTENKYKMWYLSINTDHWESGSDRFRINYATSPDGITWTINPDWVLYGSSGSWDEGGIGGGISVIKVNNTYKMWYAGTNTGSLGAPFSWNIGYATSPDGINWTKQNNGNPVLTATQSWELQNVSGPNVLYENGTYKMWYEAGNPGQYQIVYATSTDGINWTKSSSENPVLLPSLSGFDNIWVGHPSVINDNGTYKMWYTGVNSQNFAIGLATAPANTPSSLNVPQIKQYDLLQGGGQIYDSANIWSPHAPYIANWGCALTSATMILQYYGITTMPNDTPLTPGTLNTWLKTQQDGYIGNGLVNWAAISRLTYIAKLAQNNPHLQVDALEYKRVNATNFTILNSDLQDNQPDILEEPNHFIVATGITPASYSINDPYYSWTTLVDGYNNSFSSLIRYVPSHTDISYIEIVTDPSVNITLKDSLSNSVGSSYIQNPLEDDKHPGALSGNPVKIFEYPQPVDGNYILNVTGSNHQSFLAKVYFYDNQGNVKVQQVSGNNKGSSTNYNLTFSKTQEKNDSVKGGQAVTLFSTDLEMLYAYHFIDFGSYESLHAISDLIDNNVDHPLLEKILLNTALTLLRAKHGHGVSDVAFTILQADIHTLINSL